MMIHHLTPCNVSNKFSGVTVLQDGGQVFDLPTCINILHGPYNGDIHK